MIASPITPHPINAKRQLLRGFVSFILVDTLALQVLQFPTNEDSAPCYRWASCPFWGWCLNLKSSLRYLCVPLRLCGELRAKVYKTQRHRGPQRYAEPKLRHL